MISPDAASSGLPAALVLTIHGLLLLIALALVWIDEREHRLPNVIVLPTLGALLVLLGLEAALTGASERPLRAILGCVLLGGFYAILRTVQREGMGGGDVKLAAVIGLVLGWHGWINLLVGACAAFVLAGMFVMVLLLLRRAHMQTRIAFGPWMLMGAIVGVSMA